MKKTCISRKSCNVEPTNLLSFFRQTGRAGDASSRASSLQLRPPSSRENGKHTTRYSISSHKTLQNCLCKKFSFETIFHWKAVASILPPLFHKTPIAHPAHEPQRLRSGNLKSERAGAEAKTQREHRECPMYVQATHARTPEYTVDRSVGKRFRVDECILC